MLCALGGRAKGDLEGVVNASGHQLQVLAAGVSGDARDIEIWETSVDVETRLLPQRSGSEYSDHRDLLSGAGSEV